MSIYNNGRSILDRSETPGVNEQIAEQKPGQSPGDDRTKEPYDKD